MNKNSPFFGLNSLKVKYRGRNVGMQAGMKKKSCMELMEQVKSIVQQELGKYRYM